jgi:hypothetical protein
MPNVQKSAIEQYLCTGEHDALFRAWAGETFTARARQGDLALRVHRHPSRRSQRPKWMEGNSAELQTSSPETGHFDEPDDMM